MKFSVYLALLCLGRPFAAAAQHPAPAPTADQIMQQASLIFEGQLVRSVGYFNAAGDRVYRTSVIRLTHLLKGQLRAGTVQVVYRGPRAEHVFKAPQTGDIYVELPTSTGHVKQDLLGITLPDKQPIVFFCRPLPAAFRPRPQLLPASNPAPLETVGLAYDLFRDFSIRSDVGGSFPDLPALYRYLNATYALPLP